MKITYLVFIALWIFGCTVSKNKQIEPGKILPDNNGIHINAHGAGFLYHKGMYYMFGEHKIEGKKGNSAQVGVHCYSSENLIDWKDEGIALKVIEGNSDHPITKGCVLERPKVIYNQRTKQFVMWFHLELKGQGYKAAQTGLAVSQSITGPYSYVKSLRPNAGHWPINFSEEQKKKEYDYSINRWSEEGREAVVSGMFVKRDLKGGQMSRDMTLFVDDDAKAYHIAASEENGTLHIRELADDYLDFTGKYVRVFPEESNEAPAIFKRHGKYYMISSGCTGWKPNPARSAMAQNIMGPWEALGNPCRGTEEQVKTTFHSQSTYVIPVHGKEDAFIYCGDRWRPENAIDGRYVWLPIEFEGDKPIIKWYDKWNLSQLDN
ncbi:beta-glucanase [Labilibacter sediminis]|nr:beta-glucanase [Labilibacter sediminis]